MGVWFGSLDFYSWALDVTLVPWTREISLSCCVFAYLKALLMLIVSEDAATGSSKHSNLLP